MSRIDDRLSALRAAGEGALVCFVTAGDPDLKACRDIVLSIADSGADVIELGIPFSDPIADGPTIQASSMRALSAGANVPAVLDLVREIRKQSDVPLVLMTYYNPASRYGIERFAEDAALAGADGIIMTDLVAEESESWRKAAGRVGLNTIFLLAPTSTDTRIDRVARFASGFIYCVSRTGVTGAQLEMAAGVRELVQRIRARASLPVLVGFGISKADHVREVCTYADGAVVGSALVSLVAENRGSELLRRVSHLVAELKSGSRAR